ncbi:MULTISPECIES: hypothetical protein [unclassified Rhodococcus (in: high G+C Gram-positive bacteria)]|uniref:hypothetical protein n=1 Tax=unclassified Rhodococcus (in: high G+C Gram-positive bacteria) TaxID=192944 RepID=UPI0002DD9573|nr:hypothetical protein [Rhodococcus sp. DK17]
MSSVTTTLVQITRHPATRAAFKCAVLCAAAAVGRRLDGPHPVPDTPGGHNRGCSA